MITSTIFLNCLNDIIWKLRYKLTGLIKKDDDVKEAIKRQFENVSNVNMMK